MDEELEMCSAKTIPLCQSSSKDLQNLSRETKRQNLSQLSQLSFEELGGSLFFPKIVKVEKILKGSLDSISLPSTSVKIQIMGRKVCLRFKGKALLGVVNKLLKTKYLLTSPSNVLPYYLK